MKKTGKLIIITGPMFAGKTTTLIKVVQKALDSGKKTILFRSAIDNRYSTSEVVSHNGARLPGVILPNGEECIKTLNEAAKDHDIIAIDEGHFWQDAEGFSDALDELAFNSKSVYVALLDRKSNGKPFKVASELMPLADNILHLEAKCVKCGDKATFTQRIINGKENFGGNILVGGQEAYEARCRSCFVRQ